MTAAILDGPSLARQLTVRRAPRIAAITEERGAPPLLTVLSVGGDPSSTLYMKKKLEACKEAGIETSVQALPSSASESEIAKLLAELAKDSAVDGIFIETPLPHHLSLARILDHLPPNKDVEGLTPANFGKLFAAKSFAEIEAAAILIPPTPHSIIQLLLKSEVPLRGARAVVLGRSSIVGKPAAHLLTCLDATVTLCHSQTKDLKEILRHSDIVIAAIGRPRFIQGQDLKPGATVVDAGINYEGKKLCGDVDFESAKAVAGCISPVPGGVGPVTVTMLLTNVVLSAERQLRNPR